ncbi:MAG: tyrosine-type recombinase/integrase [Dehalococcoidia bacterium]
MVKKGKRWETMDKGNTSLDKLMLQYEAFNRTEGKTEKTIQWYSLSLHLLNEFLRANDYSNLLKDLDLELIRTYILYLQKRPRFEGHPHVPTQDDRLSPASVENHVRAIRAFFSWLHREGYTSEHILQRLKLPKVPQMLIEPLNDVEVAATFSAFDANTVAGARDICIITLMLDTGVRASEVITLQAKDVHLEDSYMKVMGKGQKERIVPFGSASQKSLLKYLYHFRPEPVHQGIGNFFLTLDGYLMTYNALRLIMNRLAVRSGIDRLHAHLLRHTFAVNYLVNGGDVFSLQQILGHTSLDMVRRYINLANTHVMTQHKRFSPVDRMNLRQINRAVTVQKNGRGRKRMALTAR